MSDDNLRHFPGYEPKVDALDEERRLIKLAKLYLNHLCEGVHGDPKDVVVIQRNADGEILLFSFNDDDNSPEELILMGMMEVGKSYLLGSVHANFYGNAEDGDE